MTFLTAPVLVLVLSCQKSSPNSNSHPQAGDVRAGFSIDITKMGRPLPTWFTGLSFESGSIPNTSYFNDSNTTFVNLIRGLGQGAIRVGGNTVDRTPWVAKAASGVDLRKVITDDDIDRFFKFTGATGWKVMYGLNLGSGTARYAALEANYVYSHYNNQLISFEIGNEPDYYGNNGLRPPGYSNAGFEKDFTVFYDSIKARTPDAVFSGPTTATHTMTWLEPFIKDEHSLIQMVTQHYYRMGPPSNPTVTIEKLLDGNGGIISQAETMKADADDYHLPYRIAECNSVFGGGKEGVSNTLASALWGLDFMFVLAEQGASGVNFHTGGKGTDWYTPIAFYQGQFSARPLYYGMLLFSQTASGNLLPVSADPANPSDSLNLAVHAVSRGDGVILITLINKDLSHQAFVTLSLKSPGWRSAALMRLTGPSPSADTLVTLGGSMVDANGKWSPQQIDHAALTSDGCTVEVPPCSAVLLAMR
jgi:hypothetical protein